MTDTIESLRARVAELEVELENEQARGIHSCHPGCLRDGCVNRRLRDQLAAQALTIKTMREALDNLTQYNSSDKTVSVLTKYVKQGREALALPNDATALNELIAERMKTQKEYYESVFQDGANRIAELTAEVEYWKTIRTENAVYFEKREAELTAQRDALLAFAASYIAAWNNGSTGDSDIFFMAESAIANCKEPGK